MSRARLRAARPGEVADPFCTGDFDAARRDAEDGCRGLLSRVLSGASI